MLSNQRLCCRYEEEVKTLKEKISEAKESGGVEDMSKLKQALNDLEKKGEALVKKQKDLEKKERASIAENFQLCIESLL